MRRENILGPEECTACNVDRWYSYRKEGATGRMITVAMLQSG
ncbi:MAG: laccase domain-containing protein [Nitrospinaceae bacterium]